MHDPAAFLISELRAQNITSTNALPPPLSIKRAELLLRRFHSSFIVCETVAVAVAVAAAEPQSITPAAARCRSNPCDSDDNIIPARPATPPLIPSMYLHRPKHPLPIISLDRCRDTVPCISVSQAQQHGHRPISLQRSSTNISKGLPIAKPSSDRCSHVLRLGCLEGRKQALPVVKLFKPHDIGVWRCFQLK